MLWACLHFPHLALETLTRSTAASRPLAVADGPARPCIVALDARARAAGVCIGMPVSAALAVAPRLLVHARDRSRELQSLREVAQWALQFAPAPSVEAEDAVLLEIGAGLKLFGGVEALMQAIRRGLPALGYSVRLAAAPTPTAALMLARAGRTRAVTDAAGLVRVLSALPVAALGCPEAGTGMLAELGLRDVGAVLALPRDALVRRFGQGLLDTLDRALGRQPDPRRPVVLPEQFSSRLELPLPVDEVEALLFGCKRLVSALGGWLRGRGQGVMRLRLELIHRHAAPSIVAFALSTPSRDGPHLTTLLRDRLERLRLPDRVEAIVLASEQCEPLAGRDLDLFPGADAADGTALIERLRARLGDEAVHALQPHADHRPELAWRAQAAARPAAAPLPPGPRPLWLLSEPQPLEAFLTPNETPVVLTDGPEKIESGWWEARDVCRDYFVARTRDGRTLWIFRQAAPVSGAAAQPAGIAWYVHGLFA
jgi:protein ImuB